MRKMAIPLAVFFLLTVVGLRAQTKPDFSGTWTVAKIDDSQRPAQAAGGGGGGGGGGGRRGGGGGGGRKAGGGGGGGTSSSGGGGAVVDAGISFRQGDRVTIRQTPERLVMTAQADAGPVTLTYALDGVQTPNVVPGGAKITTRSQWEGVALVTAIERATGGETVKTREVRSLTNDGHTMTVTTTTTTPRGTRVRTVEFRQS